MVADPKDILQLEVPIIVDIGSRALPLRDVLQLSTGSIIELPKGAEEELELNVNNKTIATGIAVKVGENFGIQISYIGNIQERLDALAAEAQEQAAAAAAPDPEPSPEEEAELMADDVLNQLAENAGETELSSSEEEQAA
ncbi:MAG: FliM/FliN family flagellar motor switch protein [Planctomycetota bacterium]|jgi:flagellar motor switch protein FliN/FliY